MHDFSIVLKKCMEEAGISQKKLAEKIDCSRAMIYSVLNKEKRLSEQSFRKLIDGDIFSKSHKRALRLSYYSTVYSDKIIEQMQVVNDYLSGEMMKREEYIQDIPGIVFEGTQRISGKKQLVAAVVGLLENELENCEKPVALTNYPCTFETLNHNIYRVLKNTDKKIEYRHIALFDGGASADNDIACIFENLRFLTLGHELYSYSSDLPSMFTIAFEYCSFFIVSDSAVFFDVNDMTGVFVKDKILVDVLMERADKKRRQLPCITEHYNNILELKDSLIAETGKFPYIAFDVYPRACMFLDENDFSTFLADDIPSRDMFVKMATAYFTDINVSDDFRYAVPKSGFQKFARTGLVNELPSGGIKPLSVEARKKVLRRYLDMVTDEKYRMYIFNSDTFAFGEIYFGYEIHDEKMVFYSNTDDNGENSFAGSSSLFINDKRLISVFESYTDYFIRNNLYFSTDAAARFLNDLIIQCDMYGE